MNLELDSDSLHILKELFNYTDIDKDGLVSIPDLKTSSGLQADNEAEMVFKALKSAAGGDLSKPHLTFDEFSKGIMDFPYLLEHFKNEYIPQLSSIPQDYEINSPSDLNKDNLQFITIGLHDAITLYHRALGGPHTEHPDHREDLLEVLRFTLEKLRSKCRSENSSSIHLVNAGVELYLLVRDLSRFCEEKMSDYIAIINEKEMNIDELTLNYTRVSNKNKMLENQLGFYEKKTE